MAAGAAHLPTLPPLPACLPPLPPALPLRKQSRPGPAPPRPFPPPLTPPARPRRWHTWIDYQRFQQLAAAGAPFSAQDYMLPTPEWALWGSSAAGFSPADTRFRKERRHHKSEAGDVQGAAGADA